MQSLLSSSLSATIDIVALAILLVYALYGLIRGFTKTFFSTFGSIIGLIIAILLAPSVVAFLQGKFSLVDNMAQSFGGVVQNLLSKTLIKMPLAEATQENLKGIAGFIANVVLSLKGNATVSPDATIGEAVASIFAYYVLLIICVIALFVVLKIIFFIVGEIVKKAYKNKTVASTDRILGFVLGLFNGIFNLDLLLLIICTLPIPLFQQISVAINSTVFTKFVQNINLYQLIVNNVFNADIIGSIL